MRTSVAVSLTTCIGLSIVATFPQWVSAQVPTRASEPRLVVPASEAPAQPANQPTAAAPQPSEAAPQPTAAAPQPAAAAPQPAAPAPEPVTQVTAPAGGVTTLPSPSQPTSSSAQAATMDRSYVAGKSMLTLDGGQPLALKNVEGGAIAADVVAEKSSGFSPKKHLGNVKYEEISVQAGLDSKPLTDWIAASWKGNYQRKNGSILGADYNYVIRSEREFTNALITETTIPTLDGSSKDPAYLTVKIAPEIIRAKAGSGAKAPAYSGLQQKKWLPSNFRFDMAGLDGSRVSRIESFTVRQAVTSDAIGDARDYLKEPGGIEFPNLKISLSESTAQTWVDWHNDFVVKGNNGDDKERSGAIVFLSASTKEELGRVSLFNCGIYRLGPEAQDAKQGAKSENIRRLTAELYCERMEFEAKGGVR